VAFGLAAAGLVGGSLLGTSSASNNFSGTTQQTTGETAQ